MRIKQNSGRVVFSPLSYIFQVLEMGGSLMQKYDATTGSYVPNREATPLVLQPSLVVSDPDGVVPTADYVNQMSITWTLTDSDGSSVPSAPAPGVVLYTVNNNTKRLTIYMNVNAGAMVHVKCSGTYVDGRRGEVQEFVWEKDLGCEAQTDMNVTLDTGRWGGRVSLLPMKNLGQFGIPVQLRNGKDAIPDARCSYQWQWWDENGRAWSEDFSEQAWLVSGERTKEIRVDQEFVQKVLLRVKAVAFGKTANALYWATKLVRRFGAYEYNVEFLQGKYIFHDTNMVVLNAWVANAKGIISNPCRYFDIELFFAIGDGNFESVGYGEEAIIRRSDLQNGQPRAGILCRDLSAMMAIAADSGAVICDDAGTPIFAQFPAKSRQV